MDSCKGASSSDKGRSRAPLACSFCRRRKMRCSNDQPRCTNCVTFNEDCVYTEIPKKSSTSSKSRISRLENENRRLQTRLASVTDTSSSRVVSRPSSPSPPSGLDHANPSMIPISSVSSASDSLSRSDDGDFAPHSRQQSGEYRYRDTRTNSSDQLSVVNFTLSDVEWGQKQLTVEAKSQRHLENLNFKSGQLDFDGVDPELGMHLLALHWNRQHHSFLVVHRPTFMRDMACGGPYFSKLLLNAIYFGASKFSPRIEVQSEYYRQRARTLLAQAMDHSVITTIQALLLMTKSQFALGKEKSAAWLNAGIAFRMIIDLGIQVDGSHLSGNHYLSVEDLEVRRRVFWAAFTIDKVQSLYRGRPVGLQAMNCQVPLIFLDQYEEMEDWHPFGFSGSTYPGMPTYSLSTFANLCKLSLVMNRILNAVYAEQSVETASTKKDLDALHVELDQWYSALPVHLKYDPHDAFAVVPPPHVLSLLALYNVLHIQLHHPFIADGQLHTEPLAMAPDSFTMCHTGAKRIVRLLRAYDRAFSVRKAPYLISYVTYVSATVLVRMVAQDLPGSEAQEYLRTCVAVLEENQATNWGVRSALEILVNLMKRLGVEEGGGLVLSDNARGSSQPIGVEPWSSSSLIVHNQQRKGSTEAPHALLTAKGDRNFIEPDFDIDMVFQDFAGEFDGGVETTTVDMTPNFGLPPMAYSLDSGLAGSSTQPQMLLATASGDSGDFYAAIALDQDVSGSQVSGGTFF